MMGGHVRACVRLGSRGMPSTASYHTTLSQVADCDFSQQRFFTHALKGSWVSIGFKKYCVRPTAYVMAHRTRMKKCGRVRASAYSIPSPSAPFQLFPIFGLRKCLFMLYFHSSCVFAS